MASVSSTITLVDQMSSALANIESNINSMKSTLQSVAGEQNAIDTFSWDTFTANAKKAGEKISQYGKEMTLALTAPLIMLGKKMYGESAEYEAAYTSMKKTVSAGRATEEQYQRISNIGKELSTQTPLGYVELMNLAQAAGNAGVAAEGMEDFLTVYSALQYATDQHISGDEGIKTVMGFLNTTDGGSENIEQFANSLAYLGVNANSTEDQILHMANRFAAAATIAGFTKDNIIGMAAAFESVGIMAEAGGSSAGKLIKQMQLAAEVGGSAFDKIKNVDLSYTDDDGTKHERYLSDFVTSGLEMVNYLDTLKSADKVDIADQLGITTEALNNMADSWLMLDQFAEVSGKTSEQFIQDWSSDPAQAMLSFFNGLNSLGNTDAITEKFAKDANMSKEAFLENLSGMGQDVQNAYYDEINSALADASILQTLNDMGLTEIRESNLIAAMAARPEMFAKMLAVAAQGWDENSSMWEQFNTQMETTESQNAMLGNKLENTMANFGDNLVKALQPALEMVNNLLDTFNNLSDVDQTNILKGLAVIAALGPALTIVGGALKAIAAAMQLISGHGKGAADAVQDVVNAANNGTTTPVVNPAGGAAGEAAAEAGLSTGSKIVGGVTLAAVAYLFAKGIEYRNEHGALGSVEAIQRATQDNEALRNAFVEWVKTNNELEEATSNFDMPEEQAAEIAERQQEAINKFFSMENAGLVQDLYNDWRTTNNLSNMDWLLPEDFLNWIQSLETPEVETPEIEIPEIEIPEPEVETPEIDVPQAEVNVPETPQVEIPEPEITGTDADMIEIPVIPEFKVEGDVDLLKSQFAEFGITDPIVVDSLISLGISPTDFDMSGITTEVTQQLENTQEVTNAANNLGSAAVTAANNAMSPDMVVGLGFGFGFGVTNSIEQSTPQVTSAANAMSAGAVNSAAAVFGNGVVPTASAAMSSSAVNAAKGILSSGAGSAIGRNFMSGLAGGIRAGGSAAIAAAAGVANSVKSIVSSILQIHSPSRVAYWQGEMTMLGFANGISDGKTNILNTVRSIFDDVLDSWDEGTWGLISGFAETEAQALQDEFNNVEDGVKINSSDIKKIRSLAEREVINHFTTAEVKVEMNNTNTINSEADLDSLIAKLEDKVTERLEAVAEGVYT